MAGGKVASLSRSQKILVLLLLQTSLGLVAINVALHKNGTYCSKESASGLLFDGDKSSPVNIMGHCFRQFYLDVNLGALFVVNYVIVYAGSGELIESDLGTLDHLIVYTVRPDFLTSCSQYPRVAVADQGLRINCKNAMQKFSRVKVHSLKNEGVTASEVEVHSFDNLNNSLIYRGCFISEFGEKSKYNTTRCLEYCFLKLFVFAGIKGTECGCSNDIQLRDEVPISSCSMKCEDSYRHCGGNDSITVYLASVPLPAYYGCIDLDRIADNMTIRGNMTVLKCLHYCDHHFYAVLWNGDYCFCKDSFPTERDPVYYDIIGACNMSCTGDPSTNCGGLEYVSVYSACSKTSYRILRSSKSFQICSELFRCKGFYDINGECHGGCQANFYGVHCFERDAATCNLHPCDESSSTCRNLIGSYVCDCHVGFVKEESGKCIERFPHLKLALMVGLPLLIVISFILTVFYYQKSKN